MARLGDALFSIGITFWVGGLWAIGFVAAPTIFAELTDRALAGSLAGAMFRWGTLIGVGCGSYVLGFLLLRLGSAAFRSSAFRLAATMLALTLAAHFGIQPVMAQIKAEAGAGMLSGEARERFGRWHGLSSTLYLLQSVLGAGLVLVVRRNSGAMPARPV